MKHTTQYLMKKIIQHQLKYLHLRALIKNIVFRLTRKNFKKVGDPWMAFSSVDME